MLWWKDCVKLIDLTSPNVFLMFFLFILMSRSDDEIRDQSNYQRTNALLTSRSSKENDSVIKKSFAHFHFSKNRRRYRTRDAPTRSLVLSLERIKCLEISLGSRERERERDSKRNLWLKPVKPNFAWRMRSNLSNLFFRCAKRQNELESESFLMPRGVIKRVDNSPSRIN